MEAGKEVLQCERGVQSWDVKT